MRWFKAIPSDHPIALELINEFGEQAYFKFLMISEWCQRFDTWVVDEALMKNITKGNSRSIEKLLPKFNASLAKFHESFMKFDESLTKVSETLPKLDPSNPRGSIKDRETERLDRKTEIKEKIIKKEKPTPTATALKKAFRLPEDWEPSQKLLDWAKEKRPDLSLPDHIESFKAYWWSKSGKDATKLDWDLTFQNWIRNARGRPTWVVEKEKPTPIRRDVVSFDHDIIF